MGSDWPLPSGCVFQPVFQSTLPGWGATGPAPSTPCACDFNPRSPDGERLASVTVASAVSSISIHAPRMGSDPRRGLRRYVWSSISIHAPRMGSDSGVLRHPLSPSQFQSTLPGWGATHVKRRLDFGRAISIHAPRMGSDNSTTQSNLNTSDFNPRSPDGERPTPAVHQTLPLIFQSTLPGWGATRD